MTGHRLPDAQDTHRVVGKRWRSRSRGTVVTAERVYRSPGAPEPMVVVRSESPGGSTQRVAVSYLLRAFEEVEG